MLRPVVLSIGLLNAVVLGLVAYAYLWVLGAPEPTSVSGGPEWQHPTRVAFLSTVVAGATVAATIAAARLMRAPDGLARRFAAYVFSSVVLIAAGLVITFDPAAWIA